jgi:DNA-binding LytR/AlgR family response regulator
MQSKKKNILIVEDELLIAEMIAETMHNVGYKNTFIVASVGEAIEEIEKRKPELVFTDIALKGNRSGIDLGLLLYEKYKIPFIYITSHVSLQVIEKAKKTFPNAFLSKPFKKDDLLIAVEFAFHETDSRNAKDDQNSLFIKDGHVSVRILFEEIIYLKAEKNYTAISISSGRTRLVRYTLTDLLEQLPGGTFIRIHKSYAVNYNTIIAFQSSGVVLNNSVSLPVGRSYREIISQLFSR